MNNRCEEYRTLIEQSISGSLSGEDQTTLEKHLQDCSDCSRYLEELESDDSLLRGYAGLFDDSVSRIGRATARPDRSRRSVFMRPRFQLVAAVTILIAAIVYFTAIYTRTSAFADVLEEIKKATDVTYSQTLEMEGLETSVSTVYVSSRGIVRNEDQEGRIQIFDVCGGTYLFLDTTTKSAFVQYRPSIRENAPNFNWLDWMSDLYKEYNDRKETEILDGVERDLYISDSNPHSVSRVWSDRKLDLPVKMVHVYTPHTDTTVIAPRLSLKKSSFGSDSKFSRGVSGSSNTGITRKSTITQLGFSWNSGLDDSLFSLDPPEGYSVEKDTLIEAMESGSNVLEALRQWTSISGGSFPDDINDLADQDLVEPLLVSAFDGDGDPDEEFDRAMEALQTILNGCFYAQQKKVDGTTWHYSGKGVMLGDEKSPVCWWKKDGSDKYTIIYGDLRIEEIAKKELPAH